MENQTMLRNALKANGAFSILSILVALAFGKSVLAVNEMANGNSELFVIQLSVFAAFVWFNALRKGLSKVMVIIIIVLDALYVLGALTNVFLLFAELSTAGLILTLFSSAMVSGFAIFQGLGLKKALVK